MMSSKSPTAGKSSPTKLGEQGEQAKKKSDGTKVPRKRTKTGCLTCRKRRIKCDEAKPGCGNCEKSRRNCEGYNARIVFRRSRTNPSADGSEAFQVPFQVPVDNDFTGFNSAPQGFAFPDAQHSYFHPAHVPHPHGHDGGNPFMTDMHSPEEDRRISWQHPTHEYDRMSAGYHPPSEVTLNPYPHHQRASLHHNFDNVGNNAGFDRMAGQQDAGMHSFHPQVPRLHTSMAAGRQTFLDQNSPFSFSQSSGDHSGMGYHDPYSASTASSFITPSSAYGNHTGGYLKTHDGRQGPNARTSIYSDQSLLELEARLASHASKQMFEAGSSKAQKAVPLSLGRLDTAQLLEAAAVEVEDDDYYDVKSDEEDEVVASKALAANAQPEPKLGMVRDLYNQHSDDLGIRTMDAFITPGFIDVYRPERAANPLKNEATARVFAHFITSTGPLISPFERYHGAQSSMLRSGSLASATKSLWTHTLPMMALHNQGLLHAMLAMSSMHMAKLSGASTAPSFKHYAWSIKRVHKAVSQNRQRHEVTTLAATLLLAFYEVMTADHLNWTKHLMGARQLIKEIDFGKILRRIRKAKSSQNDRPVKVENNESFLSFRESFHDSEHSYLDKFHDMDYHTVGYFMGYDIHRLQGHVNDGKGGRSTDNEAPLREVDFHNFEILQSLFWWYCKQDIVHAALAGTPPLQSYDFWAACPPRAPPGDLEAVCGSFDYLTLVLGRIVNFNGQDKARKLKTPSKGPPSIPGQKMPGAPAQASGTSSSDVPKQAPPPIPFYGMAPVQESAKAHNAYGDDIDTGKAPLTPDPTGSATSSYDEDTDRALEEWQRIQKVLDVFPTLLGPAFEPLAKGEYLDAETPFGPLIMYRRYDIACLWMFYHMARIMHARGHPSMPAAAILAVPTAAKYTAEDALTIGRIAASVTLNLTGAPLHPALAGAFTDSILPLFWAGIQYNDAAQRAWTIRRLLDIEDHTGYASASMCALGCETSWTRAAERGGPPYVRQAELSIPDDVRVKADIAGRQRSELFGLSKTAGQAVPYGASAYGAIGVLGTIEDLKAMSLTEERLL